MCGLVGAFKPRGECTSDVLIATMRDRMVHRGPDGSGLWRSPTGDCSFGHRRLSIIDLSDAASQPMLNQGGTVSIVFNGEIYNHAEVRHELETLNKYRWRTDHSDTEVLLHAYEEWGLDCFRKFCGMWGVAIYDSRDQGRPVVHLVRDRVGIKPVYFTRTTMGEWLFASEIRALLAHPHVSPEMDPLAFWHYLTFIVAPAPLTMFRGVFKLPPATIITVDHTGRAVAQQYWDCKPSAATTYSQKDLSYDDALNEVLRLLRQSIRRRMVSDVPFGVLLSGGVDSSLNVALMSELMDRPVKTFTVGYETHEEFNEFDHARRIARRYQTDHHETRIDGEEALRFMPTLVELQDEPIADNVCIPLYFLSRLVRQSGTTVVQVGEGADENFLGYWWCEHYRKKETEVYQPARQKNGSFFGFRKKPILGISSNAEDADIRRRAQAGQELFWGGAVCWWGALREQLTPNPGAFAAPIHCPVENLLPNSHRTLDSHAVVHHHIGDLTGRLIEPEVMQKIPYLEMKLRIPEHLLMRVDKMTMAHSIEARVPFLDHDLVEFAMRLPPSYKLSEGLGKRILKKLAEPYVDHDLLYRRKQGFGAPMDKWFQEAGFGHECIAALERSALLREGYLNKEYIIRLLKDQVSGRVNYGFHLWTIMNAVFWHERWIARSPAAAMA
jgi:asparagine synthase (glutamine-hydrolysing)